MKTMHLKLAVLFAAACFSLSAQALVLYGNYDPAATAPVDYSTTAYADLSGSCSNVTCLWINAYSAGFSFTAAATGLAAKAYLPMQQTYVTPGGAENIYGLTITDGNGDIVARGGMSQSQLASHIIAGTDTYAFDLFASVSAGQPVGYGVLSATAPELIAGQTYHAYFAQTYGSLSSTHWFMSDVVPASGQATQYCRTNTGGGCAYWAGYWASIPDAPITNYLPALTITDGNGLQGAPQTQGAGTVPEPTTLALLGLGLLGLAGARRKRG